MYSNYNFNNKNKDTDIVEELVTQLEDNQNNKLIQLFIEHLHLNQNQILKINYSLPKYSIYSTQKLKYDLLQIKFGQVLVKK